jgi:hypothetical protein
MLDSPVPPSAALVAHVTLAGNTGIRSHGPEKEKS